MAELPANMNTKLWVDAHYYRDNLATTSDADVHTRTSDQALNFFLRLKYLHTIPGDAKSMNSGSLEP